MPWMRTKIQIPKHLRPSQREMLGEEVVDFIINRSAAGIDKRGRKFKKYTESYAKHKGVDVTDVDLVLTGDMMDELKVLNHKNGEITIGYDKDSDINGKVEGNITGSYGKDPNPKKSRDFLGITKQDLYSILQDDAYEDESNL